MIANSTRSFTHTWLWLIISIDLHMHKHFSVVSAALGWTISHSYYTGCTFSLSPGVFFPHFTSSSFRTALSPCFNLCPDRVMHLPLCSSTWNRLCLQLSDSCHNGHAVGTKSLRLEIHLNSCPKKKILEMQGRKPRPEIWIQTSSYLYICLVELMTSSFG